MQIKESLIISSFLFLGLTKVSEQKDTLKVTVYYETYCPDSIDFIQNQLTPLMGEFNRYPDWLVIDLVPFGKAKETLKVTVYYETYCPDSINFMQNQLTPLMGEFNQYPDWLVVDLVPFGFAKETSHLEFTCQHGPKECLGNKLNACAINRLVTHPEKPHYLKLINFIYCTMNADDQIKAAFKCARQTTVNYSRMIRCFVDGTGDKLIEHYGNRTAALQPSLSWVPTVVFNDVYNKTESDEAQTNLYGVVCRYNPDACT